MNHLLEVCLVATLTAGIMASVAAQSPATPPPALQKGVSVKLPVTSNAVKMPNADGEDAVIVSITADGSIYLGVNRITRAALAEALKDALSNHPGKTLYIKADARTSYANVIGVIDALCASGVKTLGLLTGNQASPQPGTVMYPKGISVSLVGGCSEGPR